MTIFHRPFSGYDIRIEQMRQRYNVRVVASYRLCSWLLADLVDGLLAGRRSRCAGV